MTYRAIKDCRPCKGRGYSYVEGFDLDSSRRACATCKGRGWIVPRRQRSSSKELIDFPYTISDVADLSFSDLHVAYDPALSPDKMLVLQTKWLSGLSLVKPGHSAILLNIGS